MDRIYRGSMTLLAEASFASIIIDPPERDGYMNEVIGVKTLTEQGGEPGNALLFAGSIKLPSRVSFLDKDVFAPDCIFSTVATHFSMSLSDTAYSLNRVNDAVFRSQLQLIFAMRSGVNAAVTTVMHYELQLEERRITDRLRDVLQLRSYS